MQEMEERFRSKIHLLARNFNSVNDSYFESPHMNKATT